jgi:hypothetical protein
MNTRILLAVTAAVAVMAGLLPTAAHAVRRGAFAGLTSESDVIGFKVDRRGRVYGFHFSNVRLSCSDGDEVNTPRVETPRTERFRVRSNRFGIEARNAATGFGWDASGTFRNRGRRATGTIKIFASFDENNQQTADGTIKCESAALTWSVRRR